MQTHVSLASAQPTAALKNTWKIAHTVANILVLIWGLFLIVYHFLIMVIWYAKGLAGYANNDLLFIILDCAIVVVSLFGMLVMFRGMSLSSSTRKICWRLHAGGILFGLNTISFMFFKQWVVEFGFSVFFVTFQTVGAAPDAAAMAMYHPSMAVVFSVINLVLGIVASCTVVGYHMWTKQNKGVTMETQQAQPQAQQPIQQSQPNQQAQHVQYPPTPVPQQNEYQVEYPAVVPQIYDQPMDYEESYDQFTTKV